MQTSRRKFLKIGAALVAASPFLGTDLFAEKKAGHIMGMQLYTVRAQMKTDPDGTLKALAAIGYKNVEHANYIDRKFYGSSASEFKMKLHDLGLAMHSGHTRLESKHWDAAKKDFTDEWKYTVEDAAAVGQQFVISPWLDDQYRASLDALKGFMDVFNKCGELCKKSGLTFAYHNHNFEFSDKLDGKQLYDIMLESTDPKLVAQQIDIGNMYGAGGRPMEILKKYPGRFELMHVKDVVQGHDGGMDGYDSCILGKGVLNTREVLSLAKKIGGTKQFIIEQESYQGLTPLESCKQDYQIITSWGY